MSEIDKNIEEVEKTENEEYKEEKELKEQKQKFINLTTFDKVKIGIYVLFVIYALFVQYVIQISMEVTLGDFGSILTMLLLVIGINGFKWLPILSIVGIILVFLKKGFSEIDKAYFIISCFLVVVSSYFIFSL